MKKDSICSLCKCRIKENTLFSDLTEAQLDAFKDVVRTSFHKRREVIFVEGDECSGLHVIRTGRVKIVRTSRTGKEQIINILMPGDILGLEIFYDGKNYAHSAIAMDDCELCYIDRDVFYKILEREPAIARKLIVALGRELNQAYERIGNMGLLNAREKMAHLLYTLARDYGVKEDGNIKLHLTMSRLEIAELLGITQETSIRLLKSFKDEGILDIKRKEIIIKAPQKLKEIGGMD